MVVTQLLQAEDLPNGHKHKHDLVDTSASLDVMVHCVDFPADFSEPNADMLLPGSASGFAEYRM